ncbi:structural maintenance of chromosome 1 [Angomonas deanei]|uniref:Structural maintenance of chromosomes protein n=1 Tax=Angomonas deanei TaxID=59799 RepID=A0A7G2CCD2_9TRYP|nr:structural maintenance of chromosome 1 [Angomonas deanei]CAD2216681.1 RecF/RecN/SMC N terminal domain/SMC proteins Flexible Hinge Domain, putative [Angomonas deanei]|eukprot:EPY24967.1 structural maintenance of chromosome 1 [Angomonas deanei]
MDALSFVLSDPTLSDSGVVRGQSSRANMNVLRMKQLSDFVNRNSGKKGCAVTLVLRHPQGATQVETAFTRAVNGDGSMQVMINKKKVTEEQFKQALERDHKISKRVNNFLVFQHEVDRVAHKKAKELTELLEEVSGSGELRNEYNQKKKILDEANEQVVSASMEKRGATAAVNQMKLAVKEAEKYDKLKREYTETKKDVALTELFHIETELELQKEELMKFNAKLDEMQKSIASESDIRAIKKKWAEQHKIYLEELHKSRKSGEELRSNFNTLERIKAALAHLTRKQGQQQAELEAAKKADSVRSKEARRLEEEKEKQVKLLHKFEEDCMKEDKENAKAQKTLTPEQRAEYQNLRKEADCQTVTLRQQRETIVRTRESITGAIQHCDRTLESITQQQAEYQQSMAQLEARGKEYERRQEDLKRKMDEMERQLNDAKVELGATQKKNRERESELVKLQEQLHEFRYLRDTDKQNNRMNEALQALKQLFPIKGRLVDLCTIPNEKNRNAVTVAMGRNLEAVVVDSTEVAIGCVRYLKEQRFPPMTFLPLDAVQGKAVDDRLRTFGGTCKPVIDAVRFEDELEPAVRFALGETLMCDNVNEAKSVAYGRNERFKVVTLDGTMLLKNGSVQGGLASVQSRARKWDEKKYEDLRAMRDRLLADSAGGSEAKLAKINVTIRDLESRLDFTRNHMQSIQSDVDKNKEKIELMGAEIKRLDGAKVKTESKKKAHEQESMTAAKALLDVCKSISAIENQVFESFQKRENIPNLTQLQDREAETERARAASRQKFQLLIHKLESAIEMETKRVGSQNVKDLQELYERTEKDLQQCQKDLVAYQGVVSKSEKRHNTLKTSITELRAKLDELEASVRETTRNSETELARLARARKGVVMLEAACDSLRQRRLNVVRRCQMDETELPLRPHAASGGKRLRDRDTDGFLAVSEPFDVVSDESQSAKSSKTVHIDFSSLTDALRQVGSDKTRFLSYKQRTEVQLDSLVTQMETLAPNMKVATRYAVSEDRLGTTSTLLEDCREKVRKAHADFVQVKELRTERFMSVFEKIAANVDRIYQELTMGTRAHGVTGSAYLSLEDVEEPYLGGTTYHATPPMKRFMPMELLSGGERTMAALALLFAIHAVAPTPFFVLDEVDAALDAGNAGKLARYLSKNSGNCQFIVVSLKDQLYHLGDMLVGVMKDKEKNSSSVLTLDLRGYPF